MEKMSKGVLYCGRVKSMMEAAYSPSMIDADNLKDCAEQMARIAITYRGDMAQASERVYRILEKIVAVEHARALGAILDAGDLTGESH